MDTNTFALIVTIVAAVTTATWVLRTALSNIERKVDSGAVTTKTLEKRVTRLEDYRRRKRHIRELPNEEA